MCCGDMASGRARLPLIPSATGQTTTTTSSSGNFRHVEQQLQQQHQQLHSHSQSHPTINYPVKSSVGGQIQQAQDHNFNVLNTFSDKEVQIVIDALNRDEGARQREAARLMLLRFELHRLSLRRKRSIRSQETTTKQIITNGGSLDRPQIDLSHTYKCSRCNFELGRIVNRGAPCIKCNLRVCKACRDFTSNLKDDDWICIVCHKKHIEMQSAKSEWMDNFASDRQRRSSITREYSPGDDAMKKIKRSWTISTPDNDPIPSIITTAATRNGSHLNYHKGPEQGSYPSLIRTPQLQVQKGYNSEELVYEPTSPRRVLRQSTLPNPDSTVYYPNNQNLMLPVSPKQAISPQYSPYHTDNENDDSENLQPSPTTSRYVGGVRRQSTLPGLPSELLVQPKYFSTSSPNRAYSRSPDRPAPFVRQSTFPSQTSGNELLHIPRQLPTSPNRFVKSPDSGEGIVMDPYPKRQMMRQATLPNPDQHHKLLPTSPPRQLSPGYRKVSPDFVRQNTLPNPEPPISSNVVNSLSVHQHGPKFLPISPRAKQAFLFPQPSPTPRPFLSQQHFPIVSDEPQNEVRELQRQHSKMIKVRSHSNEEYSVNKQQLPPQEGRRMLPEIPPNRSPKLVRQAHVKEELIRANSSSEKRSPVFKTFADAKQPMPPQMMDEYSTGGSATVLNATSGSYFDSVVPNQEYDDQQIAQTYDDPNVGVGVTNPFYDDYNNSSNESMKGTGLRSIPQSIRNAEQFASEPTSEYYYQSKDNMKPRRRKSRELPIPPETVMVHGPPEEESTKTHRKPETMRSISEDTAGSKNSKALPRRSMSHPEKEKATEVSDATRKVPTPLSEILERQKKAASLRRKIQCKSTDQMDYTSSSKSIKSHHPHNQVLEKQDSSKSFDGVIKKVIMNEQLKKIDSQDENKSQSMDERMFVDNSIRKASIATGADSNGENGDGIFKKISVSEKRLNDKSLRDDGNSRDVDDSEHKTTLGEAEIQSAVEAAAVIFKKVVLQKRNAKRQQQTDEGEHRNRKLSLFCGTDESSMDELYGSCGDDYKLVFISSDSSSKEEEFDDDGSSTSSVHTGHNSITMDECDWDYFEPGAPAASMIVHKSPQMYRRGLSESPTKAPEDPIEPKYIKYDSDDYLYGAKKKRNTCHDARRDSTCSCGATTQYVPIPVPVPIIVPLSSNTSQQNQHLLLEDALDTENMQKAIQQLYLWNNANTGLLLQQQQQPQHKHYEHTRHNNSSKALTISPTLLQQKDIQEQPIQTTVLFRNNESIEYNDDGLLHTNTDQVTSTGLTVEENTTINCCINKNNNNNKKTGDDELIKNIKSLANDVVNETLICARDIISNVISDKNNEDTIVTNKKHLNNHDKVSNVRIAVLHTDDMTDNKEAMQVETIKQKNSDNNSVCSSIHTTSSCASDINLIKHSSRVVDECKNSGEEMITISKIMQEPDDGYLVSESVFSSDQESETDSEQSLADSLKTPIKRSYDVIGTSANVLDLSESDGTDPSRNNSVMDQRSSDSGTDTDDTGTVVDRKKSKRFTKVFVVNHNEASSDSDTDNMTQTSDSSDDDSSDNDTDIDRDCGIVLNYMKNLSDSDECLLSEIVAKDSVVCEETAEAIKLNYIKSIDDDVPIIEVENEKVTTTIDDDTDTKQLLISCDADSDVQQVSVSSDLHDHSSVETKGSEVMNYRKSCETDDYVNHMVMPASLESFTETLEIFEDKITDKVTMSDQQCALKMTDEMVSIESSMSVDIINDGAATSFMQSSTNHATLLKTESALNLLPTTQVNNKTNNDVVTTTCIDQDIHLLRSTDHTNTYMPGVSTNSYDDDEFTCESCKATNEACNTNTCKNFTQYKSKQENENEGSDTNTITTPSLDTNEQSNVKHVQDNVLQKLNLTNNKYTSLVMITQGINNDSLSGQSQVSIVTSDTTHVVTDQDDTVVVKHTNWEPRSPPTSDQNTLAGYFTLSLEQNCEHFTRRAVKITSNNITKDDSVSTTTKNACENIGNANNNNDNNDENLSAIIATTSNNNNNNQIMQNMSCNDSSSSTSESKNTSENVTVVTGADTLSAVVCLEDGLADDDSWVEEISQDEDEFATTTATDSELDSSEEMSLMAALDREEELRGYNRVSIDFTLHTIIEESCEESEVESVTNERRKNRISASELEKYFFYGLAEGHAAPQSITTREESLSESSSICSEGLDSLGPTEELSSTPKNSETSDLASSRLEKYFLTGFMGFKSENQDSDGSGSVGSDSEGHSSPEQRRKRLVRARGTGRSHSSSLDNLLAKEDNQENNRQSQENLVTESNNSSETDTCDENTLHFEKSEMSYDTAKRKKKVVKKIETIIDDSTKKDHPEKSDEDDRKTPQPELLSLPPNLVNSRKQTSRDSGFIGSNDDLLKNDEVLKSPELKIELEEIEEEKKSDIKDGDSSPSPKKAQIFPPLSRKDSFNNWSSDEETNLMMSKMRQFFKTLVAASANAHHMANSSKSSTPAMSETNSPKTGIPVTRLKSRSKPPQLVYFESELTRLMKTVPGLRDDQVREIVEYLSSEDTWSDSYDSSDYTSSDLENNVNNGKSELQEQISASCQQIINKFDNPSTTVGDEEGDIGDGGLLIDEAHGLNKETAFVYQKLVASLSKLSNSGDDKPPSNSSPPLIAKVINHIGSRLVALMHEVSSGESLASSSPHSATRYHRKLQQKISATTTEDDDSTSESNPDKIDEFMNLSRSKSHDLLLGEIKVQHLKSSTSDIGGEERGEQSDYERFSWRGSFESALLAPNDSRTKLTALESNQSPASILAAKRRSAGDLLFNYKSLSREQLDRVRSCGSIGGDDLESTKLWGSNQAQGKTRRRSSMTNCDTDESSDDAEARLASRSTLPRSLQHNITPASTNSLPRLSSSTTSSINNNAQSTSSAMQKSQSVHQILQNNVKSARFRPPGFNRPPSAPPKRAMSAPGLQPMYIQRRDRRNKIQNQSLEEANTSDVTSSPLTGARNNAPTGDPTSPAGSHTSATSDPWPSQSDDDIDRLVALHQGRHNSLSSLGVRSDSMASVYSGAGEGRYGTVTVKGQIEFGLQYNYKHAALEILIKQCKDLAAVDTKRNRSDPYVKVYLLPDKSKTGKRKTKVKKHTLNPVFDETLRFYMSLSSLESRTLWLTVWHSDMFGRNDFLGEVLMPLQGKVFDNPAPQLYNLQERSEPFDDLPVYKGDIIVGLKFIPPDSGTSTPHSTPKGGSLNLRKFSVKSSSSSSSNSRNSKGSLHVLVKEAKNLSAVKANGTCDAFCKSYLLPDKNRSSKQKTSVVKRSTNPVWNHTFIYDDVSLQDLSERALELTIWDHDRLASNEFLGGVRFSMGTGKHNGRYVEWMDATGKEMSLWQSMLNRPNFWVEGCLTLRSSLDNARVAT